jgi:hypothetical protein
MLGLQGDDGTSAATPLLGRASRRSSTPSSQDQGLPQLGYMNDLLYNASAIKAASFNDITTGNNTSSFTLGGTYTSDGRADHADRLRLFRPAPATT